MPTFLVVVLALALAAVVVMLVVRSRTSVQPRRSLQRAKREAAEGTRGPGGTGDAGTTGTSWAAEPAETGGSPDGFTDDAPRMPMGDLPPRPSRRRR